MQKEGYRDAIRGTASIKVGVTAAGNIAQTGDTVTGQKRINFVMANADNALAQNQALAEIFIGFVGGIGNRNSQEFKVTWGV